MKLASKNLRPRRSSSADNKKGTSAECPESSNGCVNRYKIGRRHCRSSSRQLNSHMSLCSVSRNPYFYRSRAVHLQVNMGDTSACVNKGCGKPRERFELKLKSLKLRSESVDRKVNSAEGKICGRDNLSGDFVAALKSESSTDDSGADDDDDDDDCTVQISKAKQTPVEEKNRPKYVKRELRNRHHNQTKVQDSKFGVTLRQHPYRRPKRNIVPKKEAAYGLLWKEEAALQRALIASIQAQRHKELPTSQSAVSLGQPRMMSENKSPKSPASNQMDFDAGEDYTKTGESEMIDEDFGHNFTFVGSDVSQSRESRYRQMRVRAQRKFASSSAQVELLNLTPVKRNTVCQSQKLLNVNGKTEHFLTFLCLRRSSFLPPHLECFKYGESDSLASFPSSPPGSHGGSSCPGTPVSLPLASDVTVALTASCDANDSTCTSLVRENMVKKTDTKEQNKNDRHSRRSLSFGSEHITEKWRTSQRKMIQRTSQQTSGTTIPLSSLTSSASSSKLRTVPDHSEDGKRLATHHRPALQSSQVASGVSRVKGRDKGDTSLKSRLRASTKALTAAVVKEQLMFAKRSHLKQIPTNSEEEEEEEEKVSNKSVRVTRSRSIPLNETKKKRLETNETTSRTDKVMINDKKKQTERIRDLDGRRRPMPQSAAKPECSLPLQSAKCTHKESRDKCTIGKSSSDSSSTSVVAVSAASSSNGSSGTGKDSVSVGEVPTFRPTLEQLRDFTVYANECSWSSKDFGICRIIPPEGWKMDCNISQELRFTPQTQYIHKMMHRWGPNVQTLTCIMHHIESQGGSLEHIPLVGGVETDMVALSEVVESCGGIQQVIDKNKWPKVAEMLRIPTVAKEKPGRLCEIYCRYLLSYDTLSAEEKKKLEEKVLNKRERDPSAFDQPCIVKSRAKTLSEFFCVARNTQSMYFEEDPSPAEIQAEYWKLAEERKCHVAVQTGRIDSWQLMSTRSNLSRKKDAATSKDGRILKSLVQNDQSLLRHVEPISGVTEPVLDIGMLFSTLCWSRDPHFLPRLYYLHTGSDIVWYSIPATDEGRLKRAMQLLTPDLIESNLSSWLPTDSVMISADVLERHGVHVYQTIQQQGQFIIIFPESFAANISCGYNIMEHINFTFTPEWLQLGCKASQILEESCEPELFSVEKLLVDLVTTEETSIDVLKIALPLLENAVTKELGLRKQLLELGLKSRRLRKSCKDLCSSVLDGGRKSSSDDAIAVADCDLRRCDVSEKLCFLSMVFNEQNEVSYSLDQAVLRLKRRKNLGPFVLLYKFDEFELNEMIEKGQLKISGRLRSPSKRNATRYRNRTL